MVGKRVGTLRTAYIGTALLAAVVSHTHTRKSNRHTSQMLFIMVKLAAISTDRAGTSSTANSPHKPVGADTQLQLLPAIGAVPLGTPGRQILQSNT